MVNIYFKDLHKLRTDNLFQVEEHKDYNLEWTHLKGAPLYHNTPHTALQKPKLPPNAGILVRNIYPTLASAYIWCVYALKIFQGDFATFLHHPNLGAYKLIRYLHLLNEAIYDRIHAPIPTIGADQENSRDFIFAQGYEHFLEDPAQQLHTFLMNIGWVKPWLYENKKERQREYNLARAITDRCTIKKLRMIAENDVYKHTQLAPRDDTPESALIRRGGFETAVELYTPETIQIVRKYLETFTLKLNSKMWLDALKLPEELADRMGDPQAKLKVGLTVRYAR